MSTAHRVHPWLQRSAQAEVEASVHWPAEEDFTAFVVAHRQDWLRLTVVLCGNLNDAEDLVQDAVMATARVWWRLRPSGATGYVRKVLVHAAIDSARRRRDVPVAAIRESPAAGDLLRYEQDQEFCSLISRLPALQRAALVCRYYLDIPDTDTARILGCSRATVRSHIHRALGQLREETWTSDPHNDERRLDLEDQ